MISTVPTLASLWPADFLHGVRLLILGGEVCPVELADRLTRRGMEVWNTYGPTEATVVTCAARLSGGAVRIGLPLDGWRVAVVDPASGRPVRWGEIGELRADPDARHPAQRHGLLHRSAALHRHAARPADNRTGTGPSSSLIPPYRSRQSRRSYGGGAYGLALVAHGVLPRVM